MINAKNAKRLRRAARAEAPGFDECPDRQLLTKVVARAEQPDGTVRESHRAFNDPVSVRGIYRTLKKEARNGR
jgi:hypothetical protein